MAATNNDSTFVEKLNLLPATFRNTGRIDLLGELMQFLYTPTRTVKEFRLFLVEKVIDANPSKVACSQNISLIRADERLDSTFVEKLKPLATTSWNTGRIDLLGEFVRFLNTQTRTMGELRQFFQEKFIEANPSKVACS
jgi:hypothetical protein